MGKFSRDKGYRNENNLRKQALMHEGIEAIRVPLSGGGSIKSVLIINNVGEEKWNIEAKLKAKGYKSIYDDYDGNYALIIKADNKKALIVVDFVDFLDLLARR